MGRSTCRWADVIGSPKCSHRYHLAFIVEAKNINDVDNDFFTGRTRYDVEGKGDLVTG